MRSTIFVNSIFVSVFVLGIISYEIKTIPEDQEYAENLFLNPGQKSHKPKTCLRKDLRNNTNVCDLQSAEFFEICKEVVEWQNIRSLYSSFPLDFDQIPEPCQNYTIRFYRVKCTDIQHVEARQCPIIIGGHRLWVSQANEVGAVFVFSENHIDDLQLRLEDYIVFIDTDLDTDED